MVIVCVMVIIRNNVRAYGRVVVKTAVLSQQGSAKNSIYLLVPISQRPNQHALPSAKGFRGKASKIASALSHKELLTMQRSEKYQGTSRLFRHSRHNFVNNGKKKRLPPEDESLCMILP